MKWTKVIVPILVAVSLLLSAILAYQLYSQLRDRDDAVRIAEVFLLNGETFRFDGLRSSIIVDDTVRVASGWRVGLNFTCAHPGYGDRTGQIPPSSHIVAPDSGDGSREQRLLRNNRRRMGRDLTTLCGFQMNRRLFSRT